MGHDRAPLPLWHVPCQRKQRAAIERCILLHTPACQNVTARGEPDGGTDGIGFYPDCVVQPNEQGRVAGLDDVRRYLMAMLAPGEESYLVEHYMLRGNTSGEIDLGNKDIAAIRTRARQPLRDWKVGRTRSSGEVGGSFPVKRNPRGNVRSLAA